MRVLIVKVSSMGDVLHTLPSLTDATQAIKNIHFEWVVEESLVQIPFWHKAVGRVIPVAIRRWRKAWLSAPIRAERKIFGEAIRAKHYDAIIDAQGLMKSAILVTRLAHGTKHGMDWQTARESLASLFYDRQHKIAKQQHAVERIRELFAKSLNYKKPNTRGDYAIAHHFLHNSLKNDVPYLIFLHTTTRDEKNWPEASWRELISLLGKSMFNIKLPWWAPHEEARSKRLAEGFNYVEILPRMHINSMAQQIAGATAVISVDTGLSHLTAALDRPNITLYGSTNPDLIGGYGKNQHICRPEHSSQLSNLRAITVFEKLELLLKDKKGYF